MAIILVFAGLQERSAALIYAGGFLGLVFIPLTIRLYAGLYTYDRLGYVHCQLDKPSYYVHDEIVCMVRISPAKNVTLNRIQGILIKREEVVYRDSDNGTRRGSYSEVVAQEILSQATDIKAGENFILKGSIVLPDAMHTFKADDNSIM